MKVAFRIAWRYLFARKSHNVINVISGISAAGMAIGTAALIVILSVFNGFGSIVDSMLGSVDADLSVVPARGKVFVPDPAFDYSCGRTDVAGVGRMLREKVFVSYGGRQSVAVACGVDSVFERCTPLRRCIRTGSFNLHDGAWPQCVVGAALAGSLELSPQFVTSLQLFYPSRTAELSLTDPMGAVECVRARPSGVFSAGAEADAGLVLLPIGTMRQLLCYEGDEVSSLEIRLAPGASAQDVESLRSCLTARLGDDFRVLDRYSRNESVYKMMQYEKLAVYAILFFVIVIIAFNIFGCLSMLIIEKRDNMWTLRSLGATDGLVRRIFLLEGWMISLLGMSAGLVLGIGFVLAQQHFGLIEMPGNFAFKYYPVILQASDVLVTALGVALTGYVFAAIPALRLGK